MLGSAAAKEVNSLTDCAAEKHVQIQFVCLAIKAHKLN